MLLETIQEIKENTPYSLLTEYNDASSFDVNVLDELPSYAKKKRYCDENLTRIGSGTSRIVYQIDDKWVLKLAKSEKGLAQNDAEASLFYSNASDVIAEIKVTQSGSDVYWIIMRYAKPAKVGDFKDILGISFKEYCGLLAHAVKGYTNRYRHNERLVNMNNPKVKEVWDDSASLVHSIFELGANYDIQMGDMMRTSSYGVVTLENGEKEIVVIDYGATGYVIDTYYSI